jgi:hypothetical protein
MTMSDPIRKRLEVGCAVLALATGLSGLFGAFVLLPSRMETAEKNIAKLAERSDRDRELLVRIEERLVKIQEQLAQQRK